MSTDSYNKVKLNSIYNLKDKNTKRKKRKLSIVKVSGVRLYKSRKGCAKVQRICIICQKNEQLPNHKICVDCSSKSLY